MKSARVGRRFVAAGAALVAVSFGAIVLPLLTPGTEPDPSRRGPERYLEVDVARLDGTPATLTVRGRTNLVDGTMLSVVVQTQELDVARFPTRVERGEFSLVAPAAGEVGEAGYQVVVRFRQEEQTEAVSAALHYQPQWLQAVEPLVVPAPLVVTSTLRTELRRLFDEINHLPVDANTHATLDQRAVALHKQVWLGKEKLAIEQLRLAISEASRSTFDRGAFERHLLRAHVLAGL